MKSPLYDQDILAWAEQQAAVLRAGKLGALDKEGLLEELEDIGSAQKEALQSLMQKIMEHLLQLEFSSAEDARDGWEEDIDTFRTQATAKLQNTPSLTHYVDDLYRKAWPLALRKTDRKMHRYGEPATLPRDCPYTREQVLDFDFYPERQQKD